MRFYAERVFEDLKISDAERKACLRCFNDEKLQRAGVNSMANAIYPLIPHELSIFPVSLIKHMEEVGFGSDRFRSTLFVYVQTYTMALLTQRNRRDARKSEVIVGLRYLAPDNCPICQKYNRKEFLWADNARMPQLPHHWGCRCTYQTLLRSTYGRRR